MSCKHFRNEEVSQLGIREGESSGDDTISDIDSMKSDACKKRYFSDAVIQQRMEEDRERVCLYYRAMEGKTYPNNEQHKRLRENIWQIQEIQFEGHDPEFDQAWELVSDLEPDDFEIMKEERDVLSASIA